MIETIECCRKTYFVITDNTVIKKTILKFRRHKFSGGFLSALAIYYISFVWLSIMIHTYEFKFHLQRHRTNYKYLYPSYMKIWYGLRCKRVGISLHSFFTYFMKSIPNFYHLLVPSPPPYTLPPSERQLKKCDMSGTAPNQTNGFPDNFGAFLGHSGWFLWFSIFLHRVTADLRSKIGLCGPILRAENDQKMVNFQSFFASNSV